MVSRIIPILAICIEPKQDALLKKLSLVQSMSSTHQNYNAEMLVTGYCKHAVTKERIPIDITNIICLFLRIIFDFDIIDKKYGTKDTIELAAI